MTRSTRCRRLLTAVVLAAATFVGPVAHAAHAGPSSPEVPERLAVEEGNKAFLVGHAIGVQIYTCNPAATPRWTFVAPRADLFGDNGQLIATHFGGPSWQARDGSRVVAHRIDGVTVDPTAIPWLLLGIDPATDDSDDGRLSATTFIQRIATTGGLAPAAATCDETTAGTTVEVPYTADYVFWKATDG